jgi:carboxypeptidase C (cathepsin A)
MFSEMRSRVLVLFNLLALSGAVSFGQIPVVDGVIGGVPTKDTTDFSDFVHEPLLSNVTTPGKLRVVENSGVCETTPGVYQASGYGDLTPTESVWFWYFNSRKNPETAPLSLWFNGGVSSCIILSDVTLTQCI